jgi:tRNA 5-methylaminomethyl-2-thiouridine biosynthesis bifunctional protein
MTDFIVIGAGVSGCSIAYFLNRQQHTVLVTDKRGISTSGSKAAGAFLSPMIGKPNTFKDFINTSLQYSINFYHDIAPELMTQSGVQRIPKDAEDAKAFEEYEKHIEDFKYQEGDATYGGGFYFDIGASVEAQAVCEKMCDGIEFIQEEISSLEFHDNHWQVNGHKAKHVILATGAYDSLIDEPYLKFKRLWGQRIVIESSTEIPHHMHKNCSISKSKDGKLSIGATYVRGELDRACDDEQTKILLDKASEIVALEDIKVVETIGGTRSATDDYFPVIGRVIDSKRSLEKFPNLKNGQKVDEKELHYYPNLFIVNGLGSRAFVQAPYLAKLLSESIDKGNAIDSELMTHRLFRRWVRKP